MECFQLGRDDFDHKPCIEVETQSCEDGRSKEIARFGMTGTLSPSLADASMAPLTAAGMVLGVEELILRVDGRGKISFVNSPR